MATQASGQLGLVIYEILREAQAREKTENRAQVRYAFFRPVSIYIGETRIPAFSREISETGIGLLHSADLAVGRVEVAIPTDNGYSVQIETRIMWCSPCGQGWYISGGEFVAITRVGK